MFDVAVRLVGLPIDFESECDLEVTLTAPTWEEIGKLTAPIHPRAPDWTYLPGSEINHHLVHTGSIPVSSREATVVDLVRLPRASGGIDNVATILAEIGDLDGSALAMLAERHGRAAARRTGWMVEHYGSCADLEPLRSGAGLDVGTPDLLVPGGPRRGHTDPDWKIKLNAPVEPDL